MYIYLLTYLLNYWTELDIHKISSSIACSSVLYSYVYSYETWWRCRQGLLKLPDAETMKRRVEHDSEQCQTVTSSPSRQFILRDFITYMDRLATAIGCQPPSFCKWRQCHSGGASEANGVNNRRVRKNVKSFQSHKASSVDLSKVGGHTVANQPPHYCPPLIHLHSFPPYNYPPRNGVRSHSRCGTDSLQSLTKCNLALFRFYP